MSRLWLVLAALSGFASVAFGAFAAHGAGDPVAKELFKTGSTYEMTHALAVFACAVTVGMGGRAARFAAPLFLLGSLLFSGSLYALAFGAPRLTGVLTPVGGLLFIAGWLALAWGAAGARGGAAR